MEATQRVQGGWNHGKFAVATFEPEEWARRCELDAAVHGHQRSLLGRCNWGPEHVWVLDLATGEGAYFRHGGMASADLTKHQVWVCPMFEPFLAWLYRQSLADVLALRLPPVVEIPDAPRAMAGYRRPGPVREEAG